MSRDTDKPWSVVYTKGRFEKAVAKRLSEKNIPVYLPLIKKLHQWSDRKKWVEVPMFPNYLFLKADESVLYQAVKTPGIVRVIYNAGIPARISEKQMSDIIRIVESSDLPEVEYDTMEIGSKVFIKTGLLKGIEGKLVSRKGKHKFCVEIEAIRACVLVEIDLKHIAEIKKDTSY